MTDVERIQHNLNRAFTVAELIEELRQHPEDAKVVFSCDYGDHCHTAQALPIESCDELHDEALKLTAYSGSGVAIQEIDGDERPEDYNVVVLR